MKTKTQFSRRHFLKAAATVTATAPFLLPRHVWSADTAPSRRLTMGFIGMGDEGGLEFGLQVVIKGGPSTGGLTIEAQGRGGNHTQPEEGLEELLDAAVRDFEAVAQVESGRPRDRTDGVVKQFAVGLLDDGAPTGGAKCLVMAELCDFCAGLDDDIFLGMVTEPRPRGQLGGAAMGAGFGWEHLNGFIDVTRDGALPRRMANGRAAFFGARRGGVRLIGRPPTVGLELTTM